MPLDKRRSGLLASTLPTRLLHRCFTRLRWTAAGKGRSVLYLGGFMWQDWVGTVGGLAALVEAGYLR